MGQQEALKAIEGFPRCYAWPMRSPKSIPSDALADTDPTKPLLGFNVGVCQPDDVGVLLVD